MDKTTRETLLEKAAEYLRERGLTSGSMSGDNYIDKRATIPFETFGVAAGLLH